MTTPATPSATTTTTSTSTISSIVSEFKTGSFWFTLLAKVVGYTVGLGIIPTGSVWQKVAGFVVAGLATLGYSISNNGTTKTS